MVITTSLDLFSFGDLFTAFTKITHHFSPPCILGEDDWNFFIQASNSSKWKPKLDTSRNRSLQHFASIAEAWKKTLKKKAFRKLWVLLASTHGNENIVAKSGPLMFHGFHREVSYSPTPSVGNNRQTPSSRWWACWELLKEPIQRWNGTIRDLWLGGGELKEVSQNG